SPEAARAPRHDQVRAQPPLHHGEAEHEPDGPARHEKQEGQRAEDGEEVLATAPRNQVRQAEPRRPRSPIEETGGPEGPVGGAREHEGFEGVPDYREDHDDPRDSYQPWQHRRNEAEVRRRAGSEQAPPWGSAGRPTAYQPPGATAPQATPPPA